MIRSVNATKLISIFIKKVAVGEKRGKEEKHL